MNTFQNGDVYEVVRPSNAHLNPGKDGLKKASTIVLQTLSLLSDSVDPVVLEAEQAMLKAIYCLETAQGFTSDKRRVVRYQTADMMEPSENSVTETTETDSPAVTEAPVQKVKKGKKSSDSVTTDVEAGISVPS